MASMNAAAIASPNIALIKYWGNRDDALRIPANGSISMTLAGLETRTKISFHEDLAEDALTIDGEPASQEARARVVQHLDRFRRLAGTSLHASVVSKNNFPSGAGLAASASAFAALTVAADAALGLHLTPIQLSRLARQGSGSAARSIFGGFAELHTGEESEDAFAESLAPPDHWALVDLIAVVDQSAKQVPSSQGHALARTSPLQDARVADAPRRLDLCREAIRERDFRALADVVEQDSFMMHAVMMTSRPSLLYWRPGTLQILQQVSAMRQEGIKICATVDAGPNVHCICMRNAAADCLKRLSSLPSLQRVFSAEPGPGARLLPADERAE